MLSLDETGRLYQAMQQAFSRLAAGWSVHILTAYPNFESCWGRTADKRRKLYNGMLKCQFYSYIGPNPADAAPPQKYTQTSSTRMKPGKQTHTTKTKRPAPASPKAKQTKENTNK